MKPSVCFLFLAICAWCSAQQCICPKCGDGVVDYAVIASVNRFQPDDPEIVDGKYAYQNRLGDNPLYFTTGYMDVANAPAGSKLNSNVGIRYASFFDADRNYLGYVENTNPAEIPVGSAFVRMAVTQENRAKLRVTVIPPKPRSVQRGFVNDICLPSKLYMLTETPNDIFVEPFLKRWRPYDDFVRFSVQGGAAFSRRLSMVATVDKVVDGSVLTVDLVNGDEFETIKTLKATIVAGEKGKDTGEVTAQIVGDSYTHGAFFKSALLDQPNVPNLKLVGLRQCAPGQFDEGRGGWRLANYFTVPTGAEMSYHGFMHPRGDYRYYGDRAFWINAWKVFLKTAPDTFEPRYSCGRFDVFLERFDQETGVLKNPVAGDVQFDGGSKKFLLFDGKTWQERQKGDFQWEFNYGKYLDAWKIPAPEFLFVMLGVNDFRSYYGADFTEWNQRIAAMKDSYRKACPDGKFVICIPCSTMGSIDNAAGDFTPKFNAALWDFRENLIRVFDKRETEGFYLVDTGVATSNEYGYNLLKDEKHTLPYAGFPRQERIPVQTGNPHPYPNYPTMGLPIAAFIQHFRK
ncbi:MAG: hypothetical protein MJ202_00095 [Lentisphaeria bacterium]|nr:hypothetical protein [Lentisphaeria bacterium]